ncbi:serine/threonine protein kinase [Blastomyces gilchristii SLH14081]|uniref:Serine/threonine protein kinase n=1 Tax=Blastomyces gilchristii (strain SLH14081) TaxID=559298 RepID=A0A179UIQ2_BLAGS|nr:serine/threonine protein kinase [Blastomyces gilchristii SLH14081]OAT07643.1 serine/threonine protein kinase [Blastomyces gilchristii SLH14081]
MDSTSNSKPVRHRDTVFATSNQDSLKRVFRGVESNGRPKIRRMIPIVPEQSSRGSTPVAAVAQLRKAVMNPWDRYQKCLEKEEGIPGMIAHAKDGSFEEMLLREIKVHSKEWLSRIIPISQKNIVDLREAFYDNGSIFLFYEMMDVSLAQIFGAPHRGLRHYEVAAFCKEVLEGLAYLHTQLKMAHGSLTADSILLSAKGDIKIADIGGCLLKRMGSDMSQGDVRSLGAIIIQCLEPDTALRRGDLLKDEKWDAVLREFQLHTQTKSAKELLQRSPGPNCLKPYVCIARETIFSNSKVLLE